jgi:hypothetical protein
MQLNRCIEMSDRARSAPAPSPPKSSSSQMHFCFNGLFPAVVVVAGTMSDDCISDGGEFYDEDDDDDFRFRRPSEDVLLKSIPIVQTQQVSAASRKQNQKANFIHCIIKKSYNTVICNYLIS